jgi:hypothetical protein
MLCFFTLTIWRSLDEPVPHARLAHLRGEPRKGMKVGASRQLDDGRRDNKMVLQKC